MLTAAASFSSSILMGLAVRLLGVVPAWMVNRPTGATAADKNDGRTAMQRLW